jgi:redox-sensitive bicupin YhaK (pirin superfamily)
MQELDWLKARYHLAKGESHSAVLRIWGCMRVLNDEEIAPSTGFAMQSHANVEIVTYVREGTLTHRDSLGNEGRVEVGNVQVVSAGAGIKLAEYNLEKTPACILRISLEPDAVGGSPAWGTQPCAAASRPGRFVPIASGSPDDQDALPIRARARVLNAKLKTGDTAEYVLQAPGLAYLIPSSGAVDVNGVRIRERDGAAISDVATVIVTAVEDADILMVDLLSSNSQIDN